MLPEHQVWALGQVELCGLPKASWRGGPRSGGLPHVCGRSHKWPKGGVFHPCQGHCRRVNPSNGGFENSTKGLHESLKGVLNQCQAQQDRCSSWQVRSFLPLPPLEAPTQEGSETLGMGWGKHSVWQKTEAAHRTPSPRAGDWLLQAKLGNEEAMPLKAV